jgi:hypothetical protein
MGSLRFAALLFCVYSRDRPPPHVHAYYGEMTAILDLAGGGGVKVSVRPRPVRPPNAKMGDIRRVLRAARMHEAELRELWRQTHGTDDER